MNIIPTRSPYHITINGVQGNETAVELFMWYRGDAVPTTPNYTLDKVIVNSQNKAYYNISPYIKQFIIFQDYTPITTIGTMHSNSYVNVRAKVYLSGVLQSTTDYVGMIGYGDYQELANAFTPPVMLTEGTYYYDKDADVGTLHAHNTGTTLEVRYTGLQSGSVTTYTLPSDFSKSYNSTKQLEG